MLRHSLFFLSFEETTEVQNLVDDLRAHEGVENPGVESASGDISSSERNVTAPHGEPYAFILVTIPGIALSYLHSDWRRILLYSSLCTESV
jgi:hypothetical protein